LILIYAVLKIRRALVAFSQAFYSTKKMRKKAIFSRVSFLVAKH